MKEQAKRMQNLPAYLFARIEKLIQEKKEQGVDVISLGIGDPDQPTPDFIIKKAMEEVQNSANHQYPSSVGMLPFRQGVADWYRKKFQVDLDPQTEVVTLIGSKEGIANINYCYVNPGDINLVPNPGYPVYEIGTLLAGGESYFVPLLKDNGFLPDLASIPTEIAKKAKIFWLNYPNNPTGAVANLEFFQEVVAFAKEYDLLVCHDHAYSEVVFDGYRAPSFLEAKGARDVGIEFSSLSKPYNMTGWRIGWAAGNKEMVEALGRYKSNVDSGAFQGVQYAGLAGLSDEGPFIKNMQDLYRERRDVMVKGLNEMGWNLTSPQATFYIWAPVPKGYTSAEFAEELLEKVGVVVTPGNGYGNYGEGFFRISLTIEKERMIEALARMKKTLGKLEF